MEDIDLLNSPVVADKPVKSDTGVEEAAPNGEVIGNSATSGSIPSSAFMSVSSSPVHTMVPPVDMILSDLATPVEKPKLENELLSEAVQDNHANDLLQLIDVEDHGVEVKDQGVEEEKKLEESLARELERKHEEPQDLIQVEQTPKENVQEDLKSANLLDFDPQEEGTSKDIYTDNIQASENENLPIQPETAVDEGSINEFEIIEDSPKVNEENHETVEEVHEVKEDNHDVIQNVIEENSEVVDESHNVIEEQNEPIQSAIEENHEVIEEQTAEQSAVQIDNQVASFNETSNVEEGTNTKEVSPRHEENESTNIEKEEIVEQMENFQLEDDISKEEQGDVFAFNEPASADGNAFGNSFNSGGFDTSGFKDGGGFDTAGFKDGGGFQATGFGDGSGFNASFGTSFPTAATGFEANFSSNNNDNDQGDFASFGQAPQTFFTAPTATNNNEPAEDDDDFGDFDAPAEFTSAPAAPVVVIEAKRPEPFFEAPNAFDESSYEESVGPFLEEWLKSIDVDLDASVMKGDNPVTKDATLSTLFKSGSVEIQGDQTGWQRIWNSAMRHSIFNENWKPFQFEKSFTSKILAYSCGLLIADDLEKFKYEFPYQDQLILDKSNILGEEAEEDSPIRPISSETLEMIYHKAIDLLGIEEEDLHSKSEGEISSYLSSLNIDLVKEYNSWMANNSEYLKTKEQVRQAIISSLFSKAETIQQ